MKTESKYKYPVGDFLSGFSESQSNPCDYELECQRMVTRGVEYLDDHQELCDRVSAGGVKVNDAIIRPLIDYMCLHEDDPEETGGQTGAMVDHCVRIAFVAKKMGWENYLAKLLEKTEDATQD
jgi:hypothetical protein